MHAVAQKAALLHTVDLTAPPKAIATNTSDALRSGIVLGQACLIDGMIRKFKSELKQQDLPIVATGGMSHVLKGLSSEITHFDPDMTLKGIAYCYESFCKR
jgi:type III pantothenate kinase